MGLLKTLAIGENNMPAKKTNRIKKNLTSKDTKKTPKKQKKLVKTKKKEKTRVSARTKALSVKKQPKQKKKVLLGNKTTLQKENKSFKKIKKVVKTKKQEEQEQKKDGGKLKRRIKELKRELEYLNKRSQPFVLLKDEEGRYYCQEEDCDQPAVTGNFCRYHYLATWKYNREKNKLLNNNYLKKTIKDFLQRYGEGILSILLKDLKNKKNFDQAVGEMSLLGIKPEEFNEGEEL